MDRTSRHFFRADWTGHTCRLGFIDTRLPRLFPRYALLVFRGEALAVLLLTILGPWIHIFKVDANGISHAFHEPQARRTHHSADVTPPWYTTLTPRSLAALRITSSGA